MKRVQQESTSRDWEYRKAEFRDDEYDNDDSLPTPSNAITCSQVQQERSPASPRPAFEQLKSQSVRIYTIIYTVCTYLCNALQFKEC